MQRQRSPFGLSNDRPPLISTSNISVTPQPLPLDIPHPDPAGRTETLERHRHDPEAQMVCGKSSRGPNRWSTARSSPTGRAGTDKSGRLFHIRCPMFLPALHLASTGMRRVEDAFLYTAQLTLRGRGLAQAMASLLRPPQAPLGFRDSSETEPGRTLRSRLVRS